MWGAGSATILKRALDHSVHWVVLDAHAKAGVSRVKSEEQTRFFNFKKSFLSGIILALRPFLMYRRVSLVTRFVGSSCIGHLVGYGRCLVYAVSVGAIHRARGSTGWSAS